MSESQYQSKIESLRTEIAKLEQKRAAAAKEEARHRDAASRALASITRTTSPSTAQTRRRSAASEERSADRERNKGVALQKTIAAKHRDLAAAEKQLSDAQARRTKQQAERERHERARHRQELERRDQEVRSLRHSVKNMGRELDAVTTALARELPQSITVLFLYADPSGALRLDEEMRSVHQVIRLSEHRDHIRVVSHWAARPADIPQALLETRPTVVHISGHGADDGALIFQSDDGGERLVPPADLVGLIRAIGESVRVIVFNSCFSAIAATAAAAQVEAAVGMDAPVSDAAARAFAEGFYRAVGAGKSVAQAFEVGRFELRNTPAPRTFEAEPVLEARDGIDPATLFLVAA
ncbi:MAG: CHAT domain-containing protein [Actinomycetota bacterium]|jgi:hypothetical protein